MINHIVLFTLAIASMPLPTFAMLSKKQAAQQAARERIRPTPTYIPNTANDPSASSGSDSSGTEPTCGDLDGLGSSGVSHTFHTGTLPASAKPRQRPPLGGGPHTHRPTASSPSAASAFGAFFSARPSGRVSGHRNLPICQAILACSALAFVVALAQMYTKKQRQAKKDENRRNINHTTVTTTIDADRNCLHS